MDNNWNERKHGFNSKNVHALLHNSMDIESNMETNICGAYMNICKGKYNLIRIHGTLWMRRMKDIWLFLLEIPRNFISYKIFHKTKPYCDLNAYVQK